MADIVIIHHSLDVNSARLLARALAKLGFDAPSLCDERSHAGFAPALAKGRAAIAIWTGAASGSAGFIGLATIAETAGKLFSLRGPDGNAPAQFGKSFMLAGWDGSDLKHPGLTEMSRALTARFKARRSREAARVAPVDSFGSSFGAEPPLNPGPAMARVRPRRAAPAPSLASAAVAALREDGDLAVLARPRPALNPAAPAPHRRAAPAPRFAPAPVRAAPQRQKRRGAAAWISVIAGSIACGALCGAVAALAVGQMAFATNAAPAAAVAMSAPAQEIVAADAAPIALTPIAFTPAPAVNAAPEAVAMLRNIEIYHAPASFEPLEAFEIAALADEAPPSAVSWRVVARQTVE
ncbi:MAG: hypothetical protein JNJ73_16710 [Hyphomonadaceae bacterium]|nr:hypothetical protein [Hyphomonadaceae bacterium]